MITSFVEVPIFLAVPWGLHRGEKNEHLRTYEVHITLNMPKKL